MHILAFYMFYMINWIYPAIVDYDYYIYYVFYVFFPESLMVSRLSGNEELTWLWIISLPLLSPLEITTQFSITLFIWIQKNV